jgi:DNA primase
MDAKEEVRERVAIEDVIGEYVQLKRAGRNWKGLSPFSAEKTPSFVVSPDKGIWHDFSSGRGGDVFSFIMEIEGLEFKDALDLLARRAGIDLTQYHSTNIKGQSSHKSKERLYEINEWAAKFYQKQFAQNKLALEYVLSQRQFSKSTALEWRLGYSPNTGQALVKFLRQKGYGENEMKMAGVTSQNYRGGLQDMFRGRLQIPLCDPQGRVIGFTARLLEADVKAPKYINTPSTPLYDKSRHVFGLHLAKEAIRAVKYVVLAEGNLDVIASHQAHVRQVVATAGTALTEQHLKTLSRLTGDIRLCFDADKAGVAATERAIPVAGKVGVNLQIITILNGKDPDELIKQNADEWRDAIDQPQYAVDWLIERYTSQLDLNTAVGKRQLSDVVVSVIRQLQDSVEQDHYIAKLADILHVSKDALRAKFNAATDFESSRQPRRQAGVQVNQNAAAATKAYQEKLRTEENLIALTLMQPKLRKYLYSLTPHMFDDDNAKQVLELLQTHPDLDGNHTEQVQKIAEYGKIASLIYETLYSDLDAADLEGEAARLQSKLVNQYVRIQKQAIVASLQTAETKEAADLLARARELDELLRVTPKE